MLTKTVADGPAATREAPVVQACSTTLSGSAASRAGLLLGSRDPSSASLANEISGPGAPQSSRTPSEARRPVADGPAFQNPTERGQSEKKRGLGKILFPRLD